MEKAQENRLTDKSAICKNVDAHLALIRQLEQKYHRDGGSVSLLAVSKTKPAEMIIEALNCGQIQFGENYAQELLIKSSSITEKRIEWHFIGPIQSNKTSLIAKHADWVHSIDRLKIATRLSAQRSALDPPLQICLQVNIDQESSKSGVAINELEKLCDEISTLDHIQLRGLMCIPNPSLQIDETRRSFAALREALESLNARGFGLDTLSMGMSNDFEAAIAEGATIIRIGTAIFGSRA